MYKCVYVQNSQSKTLFLSDFLLVLFRYRNLSLIKDSDNCSFSFNRSDELRRTLLCSMKSSSASTMSSCESSHLLVGGVGSEYLFSVTVVVVVVVGILSDWL
jgi:hypothetical protein